MQIDGPVLLYGAGREAKSTRAFLQNRFPDTRVFVTVDSGTAELPDTEFLTPDAAEKAIKAGEIGLIVKSPGVSLYKPVFAEAKKAGVAITSNLNLWGAFFREGRSVIAITGTKGKSTTATLLHLMLTEAGLDAGLAGNVGVAPLDMADTHKIVVFELSSYQTADMDFAPDIAAITTLYPEHVDWHGSVAQYYTDKLHLLDLSPGTRVALGPQAGSTPEVQAHISNPPRLIPVLEDRLDAEIRDLAPETRLKGQHNLDNAILAATVADFLHTDDNAILSALKKFRPLPHRLEEHQIGGKAVVDDSISTTPEATKAAIAAYFGQNIALIAGGFDRQQTHDDLAQTIARTNVKIVACLPVTGDRLATALETHAPNVEVIRSDSLEDAIKSLALRKTHFDTLILSPGAPSYNQFKSFEERGDAFVALAKEHLG